MNFIFAYLHKGTYEHYCYIYFIFACIVLHKHFGYELIACTTLYCISINYIYSKIYDDHDDMN